jgi:hypothetical protein
MDISAIWANLYGGDVWERGGILMKAASSSTQQGSYTFTVFVVDTSQSQIVNP